MPLYYQSDMCWTFGKDPVVIKIESFFRSVFSCFFFFRMERSRCWERSPTSRPLLMTSLCWQLILTNCPLPVNRWNTPTWCRTPITEVRNNKQTFKPHHLYLSVRWLRIWRARITAGPIRLLLHLRAALALARAACAGTHTQIHICTHRHNDQHLVW